MERRTFLRIFKNFIYCGLFVLILVVFFVLSSHHVSARFHLWPSSGDLPRHRIGMLSLVSVSPVITAFHSCCLSHHVFDQVNLWPAWVEIETFIFWQCSPGTVGFFGLIRPKNPTLIALCGPWRSRCRRWVSTVPGEHCQKIAVSIATQAGQRLTTTTEGSYY